MVKIAFIGKAEKRLFVYPILQIARFCGRTCLVTDDVTYRRLYSGYDTIGEISEVEIVISGVTTDSEHSKQIESLIAQKEVDGFDLCICAFDGYIPENTQKAIAVCGQTKTFLGWDLETFKEHYPDTVLTTVSMFGNTDKKRKDIRTFPWKVEHLQYFCRTEETKAFCPFKDKEIIRFLAKHTASLLNVKPDTFYKLAARKE